MSGLTVFGVGLDALAREIGEWPDDAIVHTLEVIGKGDDPQVLLIGSVPNGEHASGRAKFAWSSPTFKAVVRLTEYRAAIAKASPNTSEILP